MRLDELLKLSQGPAAGAPTFEFNDYPQYPEQDGHPEGSNMTSLQAPIGTGFGPATVHEAFNCSGSGKGSAALRPLPPAWAPPTAAAP